MIPSDHFVRFYNEVFKFLEKQGQEALDQYYLEISQHQELHTLELFKKEGLQGMKKYWDHIAHEENCDLKTEVKEDHFQLTMNKCPSLSKAMDNDAGQMHKYCDHCAGWIGPIMDKTGYHLVYDMISRTVPKCKISVYESKEKAQKAEKKCQLPATWPGKKQ